MAVPRNRHSNARKNSKRSHHAEKPKSFVLCKNCNNKKLPHYACVNCGFYNGRCVISSKSV